jgi:NitT/TauT family transport system ATP-binding protein
MTTATSGIVDLEELSVHFGGGNRGGVKALENVSLSVRQSEFLVIVGPSGCGKSTLLRVMAGLLEGSSGSARRDPALQRKGGVGMVFQDASLLHWRRVFQNVTLSGEILKMAKKDRNEAARRLLDLVGLGRFGDAYPRELSGGMRQRVAICRALLPDPPLLLMDEPFGSLDAISRERMNMLVQQIWSETGKTIVFVTHSVEEAVFLSDRIVTMTARPGRIADVIENQLPRPRNSDTYREPLFAEYSARIRDVILANTAEDADVYAQ